jgi:hypothetical protein
MIDTESRRTDAAGVCGGITMAKVPVCMGVNYDQMDDLMVRIGSEG